ncbi:phospho-N-acetylmuramoyl-pentapeptide-transferase, partial [Candidatus Magnetoovum chiemensis]
MQISQFIQNDGPKTHLEKEGTPTMGGILILFAIVTSIMLWARLSNHYVTIILLTVLSFGFIGFLDDYQKIRRKRNLGLTARGKFILQIIAGFGISYLIYKCPDFSTEITIPFIKSISPDLGIWYIPFATL